MSDKKKKVRLRIGGKDEELWNKLRDKFTAVLEKMLDDIENDNPAHPHDHKQVPEKSSINPIDQITGSEDYSSKQDQAIKEITQGFELRVKELAEARKLNAEAEQIELETQKRRIEYYLSLFQKLQLGENRLFIVPSPIRKQIQQCVSKSHLKQALEILADLFQTYELKEEHDEVLILRMRLSNLEKKYQQKAISDEAYEVERVKIGKGILGMI